MSTSSYDAGVVCGCLSLLGLLGGVIIFGAIMFGLGLWHTARALFGG